MKLEAEVASEATKATWAKDGKPLRDTARLRIAAAGTSRSLTIAKAEEGDAGEYTLSVGKEATSTKVTVKKPAPAKFKEKLPEEVA